MILTYQDKKNYSEIINYQKTNIRLNKPNNFLFFGENLWALRCLLDNGYAGKIDLIYIDPPFATNNTFRISEDRANSISSSINDSIAYTDNLTGYTFIEFLRERLILLRELLSENGSIYLHIDYKIGHYVKIIMDEIFGINNFRNDIARIKCNPKNFSRKGYGNIKDLILFYTKSDKYIWNKPTIKTSDDALERLFKKIDSNGRKYTTNPIHAPGETMNGDSGKAWKGMLPPKGRHWRYSIEVLEELDMNGLIEWSKNGVPRKIIYADDYGNKRLQDIWEFKDTQKPVYPTEKNSDMLNLIIRTSSNDGNLVLDSFCGSGAFLFESAKLNRSWIGIDRAEQAINVTINRFKNNNLNEYFKYELIAENNNKDNI